MFDGAKSIADPSGSVPVVPKAIVHGKDPKEKLGFLKISESRCGEAAGLEPSGAGGDGEGAGKRDGGENYSASDQTGSNSSPLSPATFQRSTKS